MFIFLQVHAIDTNFNAASVGGIKGDLGTNWIHRIKHNYIKKLADKFEVICVKDEYWDNNGTAHVVLCSLLRIHLYI